MRTRTKIISSNTCRQFFVINQSGLVGTRRILCRNTLNTNRHTLNKVSEGSIENNNLLLTDVLEDSKEDTESCNNIVFREHYIFKATFSRLVDLATVDLRNGLLRIYALVNHLLDTSLVFSILLESLYLLPYTPFHFKLSKKKHTDISLSQILNKPSASFLNRNQKRPTIIQWLTIIVLPLIIYRTNSIFYVTKDVSHVVNMMHKHVDSSALDPHKNYGHQIVYSQSKLLNKNVSNIDLYTNLRNRPLVLNVKSIKTTDVSNQNTVNDHILHTHIQYTNKLTNFVQRIVSNIKRYIIYISVNQIFSELKTSTMYCEIMIGVSKEESESNTFGKDTILMENVDKSFQVHNNKLHICRYFYKNKLHICRYFYKRFEFKYYCLKGIDNKLNWLANLINSTHQSLRCKIEDCQLLFFRYRYRCQLRTLYKFGHLCDLKVIKTSSRPIKHRMDLNQFVNVVPAQISGIYANVLHKNNSLISVVKFGCNILHNLNTIHSKLNKDYTYLLITDDILNKLDRKNVLSSKTLANDSCNLKQPIQRVSRLCNDIRWHHVSNLLVSHKDTKTKSVHTFSNRIDVVLYEQMETEIKSIRQPTNLVDYFVTISPIQLKWNQNTTQSTLWLNLQQLLVTTSTHGVYLLLPNINTIRNLINEFDSSLVKETEEVNISKLHNHLQPNQLFFETNLDNEKLLLIDSKYSHFSNWHELVTSNKLNLFQNYRGWIFTSQWWIMFEKTLTKTVPFLCQNLSDWIQSYLSDWIQSLFLLVFFKPVLLQQKIYFDLLQIQQKIYFDLLQNPAISNHVLSRFVFDTLNHLKTSFSDQLRSSVRNRLIQDPLFNVFEFRIFVCTIMLCLLYFNGVITNWSLWNKFSIARDWTNPTFKRREQFLRYKAFKYSLFSKYTTLRAFTLYRLEPLDLYSDEKNFYLEDNIEIDLIPSSFFVEPVIQRRLWLEISIHLNKDWSWTDIFWKPFPSNWAHTLVSSMPIVDLSPKQIETGLVISSMLENVSLKLNKMQKPLALDTEIINRLGFQTLEKLENNYHIYSSQLKHEVNHLYDSKNIYFATSSFSRDLNQFVSFSPVNLSTDLGSTTRNMSPFPIQINQRESTIGVELAYKALFLAGSAETELGMSSFITNLANTLKKPLIRIKIDEVIVPYVEGPQARELMQGASKMLFIIDQIQVLDSCVVWVSDFAYYYTNSIAIEQNVLLSTLLKSMQDILLKKIDSNMNFVVTNNNVRNVDPSILFSQHFDLVSVQIPNKSQHRTNLLHLLYAHNLHLEYKVLNQIVDKAVGSNWISSEGLINELCLIAKTQHKNVVDNYMAQLALFRQNVKTFDDEYFTFSVLPALKRHSKSVVLSTVSDNVCVDAIATWSLKESTNYKVGKIIVQSLFHNSPLVFDSVFSIYVDPSTFWKNRFYSLATGYLEIPFRDSTITESIIFPYILTCLAGLAAQDAARISVNNITNIIENRFMIDVEMEQDHKLALRLFGSLFSELASKDIYGSRLMFHSKHCLLPKFGDPGPFDVSNYRISPPLFMQILSVISSINRLSPKHKVHFNQNQFFTRTPSSGKIWFTWSHIMTRFDVSSNPSFETMNDKESEAQLNVISPTDAFKHKKGSVFVMVAKKGRYPYKRKKANIYDEDEVLEHEIKPIELIVLSFLESNPFNCSVLFLEGKKTLLSDTNALTMKCVLPGYRHLVAMTKNSLVTLYLSFKNIREPSRTRFIKRCDLLADDYKEMLLLKKLAKLQEDIENNREVDTSNIDNFNDNDNDNDNHNDNDNDNDSKQETTKTPSSLKGFELMLKINVRITNSYYFKRRLDRRYLNIVITNEILQKNVSHLSNSCPQKDMSKENQKTSMFKERLLFGTILESYHYLLYFYLLHNSEYVQLKRDLIKQGVVSF